MNTLKELTTSIDTYKRLFDTLSDLGVTTPRFSEHTRYFKDGTKLKILNPEGVDTKDFEQKEVEFFSKNQSLQATTRIEVSVSDLMNSRVNKTFLSDLKKTLKKDLKNKGNPKYLERILPPDLLEDTGTLQKSDGHEKYLNTN